MVEAVAAIALGLLGAAGVAKMVEPAYTAGALAASGLPSMIWIVRLLGMAEIMAAFSGLVFGGLPALPAAVFYAGFSIFTIGALRRDTPLQSCGCFGREETPPSVAHVVFNIVAAAALAAVVVSDLRPIPPGPAVDVALYVGMAALGTFAAALTLTRLPSVLDLARAR